MLMDFMRWDFVIARSLVRERRLAVTSVVVRPIGVGAASVDWVAFRRGSGESPLVSLWKRDSIAFLGARAWDNRRFCSWHCLSAPWNSSRIEFGRRGTFFCVCSDTWVLEIRCESLKSG